MSLPTAYFLRCGKRNCGLEIEHWMIYGSNKRNHAVLMLVMFSPALRICRWKYSTAIKTKRADQSIKDSSRSVSVGTKCRHQFIFLALVSKVFSQNFRMSVPTYDLINDFAELCLHTFMCTVKNTGIQDQKCPQFSLVEQMVTVKA